MGGLGRTGGRAQVEAFVSKGWHCVAPDMRGYGRSSALTIPEAFALKSE
jgi:pimeloyl-ACP methyl ester carboxylesterase